MTSIDIDTETIDELKNRNGRADPDRDEEIDDLLDDGDERLLDADRYPRRHEDLSDPIHREFVVDLLRAVETVDEAVDEIAQTDNRITHGRWERTLDLVIDLYDLDPEDLLGEDVVDEVEGDVLDELLGEGVADELEGTPTLTVALYQRGLSVSEIAEVLDRRSGAVRDALKELGFVEGKTRDEQTEAFEENDGRIGGVTIQNEDFEEGGRGITINADDFADE